MHGPDQEEDYSEDIYREAAEVWLDDEVNWGELAENFDGPLDEKDFGDWIEKNREKLMDQIVKSDYVHLWDLAEKIMMERSYD